MFNYDSELSSFINFQELSINHYIPPQFYYFLPIQSSQQIMDNSVENLYGNVKLFTNYSTDTLIIEPNENYFYNSIKNSNSNEIITDPSICSQKIKIHKVDNAKSYESGQQKDGRNANSNLLRMFFRRLELKLENQSSILYTIFKKYKLSITPQEFIQWLKSSKVDFRNYIRVPTIRKMFVGNTAYCKVLRILLKDFLQKESIICYHTSRKIKKQSMHSNYQSIRDIFNEILQVPKRKQNY